MTVSQCTCYLMSLLTLRTWMWIFPNICIHSTNTSVQRTWLVKSTFLTCLYAVDRSFNEVERDAKDCYTVPLLLLSDLFYVHAHAYVCWNLLILCESVLWRMRQIWESSCLEHWNQKAAGLFWFSSVLLYILASDCLSFDSFVMRVITMFGGLGKPIGCQQILENREKTESNGQ